MLPRAEKEPKYFFQGRMIWKSKINLYAEPWPFAMALTMSQYYLQASSFVYLQNVMHWFGDFGQIGKVQTWKVPT